MAKQIIGNAAIWLDGYDLRTGANVCNIDGTTDAVDVTCFADTSRAKLLDIPMASVSAAGYMDSGFESGMFGMWGLDGFALTVATKKLAAELAFVQQVSSGVYNQGAARGQPSSFRLAAEASNVGSNGGFGRGRVLQVNSGAATTATGTIHSLRTITVGKRAFASVHVTSIAGTLPSITVRIESAAVVGFGSPTTRATFTAITGVTGVKGQVLAISGTGTDAFWRAAWTVSGTLPVIDFAVALGFEEGF